MFQKLILNMQQAQRNQAVAKTNEIEEPPVSFRSIEDLQQSGINVRYYILICYPIYHLSYRLLCVHTSLLHYVWLYFIVALCVYTSLFIIIDRLVT